MKSEHRPIAAETPRAIEDLAEMIAVDTEFPPGAGYTAFADLAEPWLYALGMEARRVVVPEPLWRTQLGGAHGDRVNLLGVRRTGRPICSIYVHVDTLPAAADWTLPPLRLIRIGNRLHGLGAADTKGALAAALLALRAAERAGVALAYDPALLLCTDEENGLHPGVRHLAEQRLIEGHIVNLNGAAAARIWAGCFGSFDLAIRLRGAAAHAGDAARGGANAIEAGLPVLAALDRLRPLIAARHSAMPAHPDATGPLAGRLSITSAHGGTGGSSLPAVFDIVVNRRYAAEERFEEALEEIEAAVRAAAPRAETELIGHLPPVTDPTGPHWPRWQAALCEGFGFDPAAFLAWGAASSSDFGWVQKAGTREVLLGGLIRPESRVHAGDEFTTVQDLQALAQALLAYLAAGFRPDLNPDAPRSMP